MGVVKANAYGHGAIPIAKTLVEEGVLYLATATIPEAIQLREAGVNVPILVLAAPLPAYLSAYVHYDLDITIPSLATAKAVVSMLQQEAAALRVHVKVDTGMGRLGITPSDLPKIISTLTKARGITLTGLWTHFATAIQSTDPFALQQLDHFGALWHKVGDAFEYAHLAHSGAIHTLPQSYLPYHSVLVRPGLALYGLLEHEEATTLRPLMRFSSQITHLKTIEAGTSISYGHTWTASRKTHIAVVGAGYADGYPRLLSNQAYVGLQGRRYPVVGTICMDMFMIDLGDNTHAEVGNPVVLFGEGGPTAIDVARWAQTIPYEICCGISSRVPRQYSN